MEINKKYEKRIYKEKKQTEDNKVEINKFDFVMKFS